MNKRWVRCLLWGSWLFFLIFLLVRQETATTQDLGRHLILGEMLVTDNPTGSRSCALYRNCLTFTHPDFPFVNHHWGSEVIFYLIYKLGGFPALVIFKSLVLGGVFVVTTLHASRIPKAQTSLLNLCIAIILTFLSVQMMATRLTTRPEIFGYLLFSLLFWLLNKSYKDERQSLLFYITPVIILLWVNLHISFVFGLILIWLWAGSKILNEKFSSGIRYSVFRIQYLKFLTIAILSTLVTLLNPAGLRGAMMPFSILRDYGYTIVENMTPFFLRAFKPQPEYWIYIAFEVTTLGLFFFSSSRKNLFHLLTFLTFSLFPLLAVRHLPFFALAIAPVLAPLLAEVIKSPAFPGKAGLYHIPTLVMAGLFLAAVTNPIPLAYAKLPPVGFHADPRHDKAIQFVKEQRLQGNLWNNYDIGSYLEWRLPGRSTFVDGRPEAFPVGFFSQEYIPMQQRREEWDRLTRTYDIQWTFAALTDTTPWFQSWWSMIRRHENWRLVYTDNATAILVRRDGANRAVEPIGSAKIREFLPTSY